MKSPTHLSIIIHLSPLRCLTSKQGLKHTMITVSISYSRPTATHMWTALGLSSKRSLSDLARKLIAAGHDPELLIEVPGRRLPATLSERARWVVYETDAYGLQKRPWKPHPSQSGSPDFQRSPLGRWWSALPPLDARKRAPALGARAC